MDGRPSYVVFPLSLNNSAPPILLVRLFLLLGGDPDRVHPSAVIEASNVRLIPTPFHMAPSPPRDVEGSAIGVLSVVPSVVQVVGVSHRARDQKFDRTPCYIEQTPGSNCGGAASVLECLECLSSS